MIAPRQRKCKVRNPETNLRCNTMFTPDRPFVMWCSPDCGANLAAEKKAKQEAKKAAKQRRELRNAREKTKTCRDWIRDAQAAFNAFIRARDEVAGYPCISCAEHNRSSWDAGHYRATSTAPALRFNEENVHRQCVPCNRHKHGNLLEYRAGLIKRIGLERVEWLEGPHEPAKHTIPELQAIKAKYAKMARELRT